MLNENSRNTSLWLFRKKKVVIALVLILTILSSVLTPIIVVASGPDVVIFADAVLEKAVRDNIGKSTGDILKSDVSGIRALMLEVERISNLSGIENLTSLGALKITNSQLSDLRPLASLPIYWVDFSYCQISDISVMANFTGLQYAYLKYNHISDVSALMGKPLGETELTGNPVSQEDVNRITVVPGGRVKFEVSVIDPTPMIQTTPTLTPVSIVVTPFPIATATIVPTLNPTPTPLPTTVPTIVATIIPTIIPSILPTIVPTIVPTKTPTIVPTKTPTIVPTKTPGFTTEPLSTIIPSVPPKKPKVKEDKSVDEEFYVTDYPLISTDTNEELPIDMNNYPKSQVSPKFSDINESHWAYKCIVNMAERQVIKGYPDKTFQPDKIVTRAEFAVIMVKAAGLIPIPNKSSFYDVVPSDWFAPYVEAAKDFLTGYQLPNGQIVYKANEPALREDVAIALIKLKGYDISNADVGSISKIFTDSQTISDVAIPYVVVAVEKKLISGFPGTLQTLGNTFRGQESITRAQASTLLWNAFMQGNSNKVIGGNTKTLSNGNDDQNLNNGLVAYYKFDENVNDSSENLLNGIVMGKIEYVNGVKGKALSFDGEYDNYIDLGDDIKLKPSDNLTLSFWVSPNKNQKQHADIISCHSSYNGYYIEKTSSGNNQYVFGYGDGENWRNNSTLADSPIILTLDPEKWNHFTSVLGDNTLKLYLDGKLIGSKAYTSKISYNQNNILIGNWLGKYRNFKGTIDEFRIYNRALSENEVKQIYQEQ